jgi:hypothetical protein
VLAVGQQCYVFRGHEIDTRRSVVIKQPNFDYRFPIRYGRDEVSRMRCTLQQGLQILRANSTGHFPEGIELVVGPAIVAAAADSPLLAQQEIYLIEEYLVGWPLDRQVLETWQVHSPAWRETTASQLTHDWLLFWQDMHDHGWHYGDISCRNCIIQEGRLRVVDGGSCVPRNKQVILPYFTPAFMTPVLYDAVVRHLPIPGSLASVLPVWAKVLHFCLTRQEPVNGAVPDLRLLEKLSPDGQCAITASLAVDHDPTLLAAALEQVHAWIELGRPGSSVSQAHSDAQ